MKFTSASAIEQITWELRLADYERSKNRARINDLFNGSPPYTDEEVDKNNIETNVNFLEPTKIAHDARRQFYNAFLNPNPLFTVAVDAGPLHKRQEWGNRITTTLNRIIKESLEYLEVRRSTFAATVLHGIGPAPWEDRDHWCPYSIGVEDVLLPANTLLTLKNLPFFAIFRQYTAMQLIQLTSGPKVDRAWDLPMVKELVKWADEQTSRSLGGSWPEVWSPEKMGEREKQDSGLYASNAVPTIDCWDFYFWNDNDKHPGWNRRIVLDTWNSTTPNLPAKNKFGASNGRFLYNPEDRVYADKLGQIIHWQFADASCVSPFRYHSVRSLGFLLYSICHLQNRLRCRFNDSVFEALLQYFRVSSPDDMERLQKVDLADKGVLPEGLNFVKREERWEVNENLIMQALQMNRQSMIDNAAAFTQDLDLQETRTDETATRTMAKVNATAALVGAMLNQAYNYQAFQYQEICARFRRPNSADPDVNRFRARCLKQGIPIEAITEDCWDVRPVRTIGSGNKMLQVAIADKLVAMRQFLNPEAQREVDRIYIGANSDDWDLAERLVPEQPQISPVITEAQLAMGTLMQGLPVTAKPSTNHVDYIEAAMASLAAKVQQVAQRGGVPTPDEVVGLQACVQHIGEHIAFLAQNPAEKERVKQYSDDLGKLVNEIKAFQQRLAEMQKKQAEQNGAAQDPEVAAKLQGQAMLDRAKADAVRQQSAQKTAQDQLDFEQEQKQKAEAHRMEMQQKAQEAQLDMQVKRAEMAADIQAKRVETELKIEQAEQTAAAQQEAKAEGGKESAKPKKRRITFNRDKSGRVSGMDLSEG